MKTIGIKLADGSFYPVLTEGTADKKELNLTTVKDGQTTVQVDLYRSESGTMEDAEYVDTLEIKHMKKHPNGEPDIALDISLDENGQLNAELHDPETGKDSSTTVSLVSRTLEQRSEQSDVTMASDSDLNLDDNTLADDDFDLDASLNSNTEQETFDSDEDITFDPNSLQFDSIVEENSESTDENEITMEEPAVEETATDDFNFDAETSSDVTISEDDFAVPEESEISFDEPAAEETSDTEISFDEPAAETNSDTDLSFDEPAADDDFFNETTSETQQTTNAGLDFSDILDEETKEGHAAATEDTESIKKTKVPVLICIICAVICIIAVILILIFSSKKKCNVTEAPKTQIEKTEDTKEASKYDAKENEIVVAPATEVVPEAPKAKPASKNITYKIKWGDTLWDLAKTYYNNPWKYPKIAKYNGIKNPDHIISGTTIVIPAE